MNEPEQTTTTTKPILSAETAPRSLHLTARREKMADERRYIIYFTFSESTAENARGEQQQQQQHEEERENV